MADLHVPEPEPTESFGGAAFGALEVNHSPGGEDTVAAIEKGQVRQTQFAETPPRSAEEIPQTPVAQMIARQYE